MHKSFAVVVLMCAACGSSPSQDPTERPTTFGGARPAQLHVPDGFDDSKSYPLIVVLHGYGADGVLQEAYFGVRADVDAGKLFTIAPDGLVDSTGHQFWNADPACCDLDHTNPDDSGYIGGLIDDITAAWPISNVFVIGHSNGGYMAYRMACDRADAISAIGVLAGIVSTDPAACKPSQPVSVLHMHGTDDDEVPFAQTPDYAGAMGSVERWAGYDSCATTGTADGTADFDSMVAGDETTETSFACAAPLGLELWTLTGSTHIPVPTPAFEPALVGWLESHAP